LYAHMNNNDKKRKLSVLEAEASSIVSL
jgi:hypothetical protein